VADIAVIGSSLIMTFYASILSRQNKVTVYEQSDIGGSWIANEFRQGFYPVFNNLICPLNEEEDDLIKEIATFVNEAGGNVEVRNEKLSLFIDYEPKKYIVGDFFSAIMNNLSAVSEVKKEKVSTVEIMSDGVSLNGTLFNKIIFPENFIVDQIVYEGKKFPLEHISFVSKHLRACVASVQDLPYYSEGTDNIFDRGGKFDNHIFIGRIRNECKEFNDARFISESSILSNKVVIDYQVNRYHNSRLSEASLRFLKKISNSHICYADTAQFCRSYMKLRENLLSDRYFHNKASALIYS